MEVVMVTDGRTLNRLKLQQAFWRWYIHTPNCWSCDTAYATAPTILASTFICHKTGTKFTIKFKEQP